MELCLLCTSVSAASTDHRICAHVAPCTTPTLSLRAVGSASACAELHDVLASSAAESVLCSANEVLGGPAGEKLSD